MKKIYILMIAVLLGGIAKGQWQNQATKPNAKNIINKTISEKIPQSHFYEQLKKPIASKSVSWNYDTIVAFDWLNNIKQRITQTFDGNGNVLTNITQNWDYNTWDNFTRYTYTYDNFSNKLTDLYEKWQNNAWVNYSKNTFTFDANGKKLTDLWEQWQNNAWVIYGKSTYTYNPNGNMLTKLHENWQNNAWQNGWKETYTYDANGHKLTELSQLWQINAWVNSYKYTWTYDANGNMLTKLHENWQNNAWVNNTRYTYTYDINGNMLTDLWEKWQNNVWLNSFKVIYTYDVNGNMLTKLYEDWQNNAWLNKYKDIYTYDVNGNMLTKLYEDWQNNAWVNNSRYTYTYDVNGNMLTYLKETWFNNAWLNNNKNIYTYDSFGNSITGKYEWWYNNWQLGNGSLDVLSSQQKLYSFSDAARYQAHFIYTNPNPQAAGTISGATAVCQGQTNVTYNVPTITNATSYIWTLPSGASGTSSTNTITVNYSTSAVSGYITVKGSNSFGTGDSSSLAITVNSLPVIAGNISGFSTVCAGQTSVTYTIPVMPNATSYIWTLPTGASGNSITNSITVNYGTSATSGNIAVKVSNACGIGDSSILAVTVNVLPDSAGIISGLTTVCQGQNSITYTTPAIANATSYVWTLSTGATGNSSTNTITVNYGYSAVSGNITVKGNNSCGDGISSSIPIIVKPIPTTPVITQTGNTLLSNMSTGNQWYNLTSGLINNATSQTYNPVQIGNYFAVVTQNGCSSDSSNIIFYDNTGINEKNLYSDGFKIYPNPVKENLIIEMIESNISQKTSISIYNIQGQLCRQILSNQSKIEIDIKDLSTGLYMVKVNNEKESFVSKFVME